MVLHLVGKSTRQGRREDVEEAHSVHHGQREPGVFRSEYTVGENGLRREERWKNLLDGHLSRLHRYRVTITDRRRCSALTAMSDRVMRSDTSVSSNAFPWFARKFPRIYRLCFYRPTIASRSRRRDTIERSISISRFAILSFDSVDRSIEETDRSYVKLNYCEKNWIIIILAEIKNK